MEGIMYLMHMNTFWKSHHVLPPHTQICVYVRTEEMLPVRKISRTYVIMFLIRMLRIFENSVGN